MNRREKHLREIASSEGWEVGRTKNGHYKFTKAGVIPFYTGGTPGRDRIDRNLAVMLRTHERLWELTKAGKCVRNVSLPKLATV